MLAFYLRLLILFCFVAPSLVQAEWQSYELQVQQLNTKDYKGKAAAIQELPSYEDERTLAILQSLLEGRLFFRKNDGVIVFAEKTDSGILIQDALSGEDYGEVGKREAKKIRVNNKIRKVLKGAIASIRLSSEDSNVRATAARDLLRSPSQEVLPAIQAAIQLEQDPEVLKALALSQAAILIESDDEGERLAALDAFDGSKELEAMSIMSHVVMQNDDGSYVEQSLAVRDRAGKILKSMQREVELYKFVENLFFGISLGSVLLLAAVGLAITFGVMGVINMAHGEMIMLGAYTTYVVQQLMPDHIGISILVAIPAAFLVSGLVGIILERGVIRFLYGRPLETLLATFGVSLILQQLVRTVFSPLNRSVVTPEWMSGSWAYNGLLSFTYNRMYVILFALMVLVALITILRKTFFGLQMRAVTQNRAMASSMGIKTGWIDALTFGLGSGVAGMAGVALSQLTNVGPNLGQAYIIDSFMVVVFGGVGNLFGTFFGALSLGIVNKFVEPYSGAVLGKIIILVFVILFIQRRPRGLFALKGRTVED